MFSTLSLKNTNNKQDFSSGPLFNWVAGKARFRLRQTVRTACYNFLHWHRSPRIFITFALAFILCFLLSGKAVGLAREYETTLQIGEAFIWTFGDGNSIMLSSLLLVLLFGDMPFISGGTPFYLIRMDRKTWLWGQGLYIVLATGIYMAFILLATGMVCLRYSFFGNVWSETAARLAYGRSGYSLAVPVNLKTLEMSSPYETMGAVFLLMLLYGLLTAFIMLVFNLLKGQLAGVMAVLLFSLYGLLLNPGLFKTLFGLTEGLVYKANVLTGWLSPLNHATYAMHSFGYDLLPRLWTSCLIFAVLIILLFLLSLRAVKRYQFIFTGTEG